MSRPRPFSHASRYPANRGYTLGMFGLIVLFTLSVAGAAWVSLGIVAQERWPIRWLEINGSFDRISAEQLRGGLMPFLSSSFFTVDLRSVHRLAAKNSWVAAVSVQKRWPDAVTVTIEEHVPLAHWNSGHLISTKGESFAVAEADEIQGLPWLYGPDEQMKQVLDHWRRFNTMLDAAALEIEQLTLDPRGAWSLQTTKGTQLSLGREDPSERLTRLMSSWDTLLREHELPPALVDLRYTNGFAVRWPKDAAEFVGIDKR